MSKKCKIRNFGKKFPTENENPFKIEANSLCSFFKLDFFHILANSEQSHKNEFLINSLLDKMSCSLFYHNLEFSIELHCFSPNFIFSSI